MEDESKNLQAASSQVFAYFICDKAYCKHQNNRKITKYDRELIKGYCPIINTDDTCDKCGNSIREPIYIEVDPYQKKS